MTEFYAPYQKFCEEFLKATNGKDESECSKHLDAVTYLIEASDGLLQGFQRQLVSKQEIETFDINSDTEYLHKRFIDAYEQLKDSNGTTRAQGHVQFFANIKAYLQLLRRTLSSNDMTKSRDIVQKMGEFLDFEALENEHMWQKWMYSVGGTAFGVLLGYTILFVTSKY